MRNYCADLVQNLRRTLWGMGLPVRLAMGLIGTEIYIVGASITRPFLTVFSTVTGLAEAKDVSALSFMRLC